MGTLTRDRLGQWKVEPAFISSPAGAEQHAAGEDRLLPQIAVPMLWRAFLASALIMTAAALLLSLTPVAIESTISTGQLGLVMTILGLMLILNLWALRRVLAPVGSLTEVMTAIEPGEGLRIAPIGSPAPEITTLGEAFNEMLERLEAERRESGRAAISAQERERWRLAAELHDEIGQRLVAAAIQIEHAADSGGSAVDLHRVAASVRAGLDEVRVIAQDLRPESLEELGLVNALIALCSRVEVSGRLRVERRMEPIPSLTPEQEMVIYRVAQESLTNVAKHSGAATALISLSATGGTATLSVLDDGRGLPTSGPSREGGIRGMRERARFVGGRLDLEPRPGGGTSVRLEFPLPEGDGRAA